MRSCVVLAALAACGRLGFEEVDLSGPPPLPPSGTGRITAGRTFTCAIKQDRTTWCWGSSTARELGGESLVMSAIPQRVDIAPLAQIAAGDHFACGIDLDGGVWCWGANGRGELGQSNTDEAFMPLRVELLPRPATGLGLGSDHACAILDDKTLWCWGKNDQLSVDERAILPPTQLLADVTQVVAGDAHTCALLGDGTTVCWGVDGYGTLGTGTGDHAVPERVDVAAFRLFAGTYHVCALVGGGRYSCWGNNSNGELGLETEATTVELPQRPSTTLGLADGAAGHEVSCAIDGTGRVACWGDNDRGQLAQGTTYDSHDPMPIAIDGTVVGIAAGGDHACAIRDDDSAVCWGVGSHGELGDGRHAELSARPVTLPGAATDLAAGIDHACALVGGEPFCWGSNNAAQLGTLDNGPNADYRFPEPRQVGGVIGATKLAAGGNHTCALGTQVTCWGGNDSGQLGRGTRSYAEDAAATNLIPGAVTAIAAGNGMTCAIASGTAYCWGANEYDQLGDGTTIQRSVPGVVDGGVYTQIVAGEFHACAIESGTGRLACWGNNEYSQLGCMNCNALPFHDPDFAAGSLPYTLAAAAFDHTCALTNAGTVECWGANDHGQLGDNTLTSHDLPAASMMTGAISALSTARATTCAIANSNIQCWGANDLGQLGTGGTIESRTPVSGPGAAVQVAVGGDFACSRDNAGMVACWGDNWAGQLGIGVTSSALAPVAVAFP